MEENYIYSSQIDREVGKLNVEEYNIIDEAIREDIVVNHSNDIKTEVTNYYGIEELRDYIPESAQNVSGYIKGLSDAAKPTIIEGKKKEIKVYNPNGLDGLLFNVVTSGWNGKIPVMKLREAQPVVNKKVKNTISQQLAQEELNKMLCAVRDAQYTAIPLYYTWN